MSNDTFSRELESALGAGQSVAQASARGYRAQALEAIQKEWRAEDAIKEAATLTIERSMAQLVDDESAKDAEAVAQHIYRHGNKHYISAFRKYAADPQGFAAMLTPEEARAWQYVQKEDRATLTTGGAVLPSPMDPTIVLTSDGQIDPMRGIARVDSTASNSKRYITSAGSSFSYDAELDEVSDDTPSESEVTINVHKGQGWLESSMEVLMDQPEFSREVAVIIGEAKAALDSQMWVNGAGDASNQPFGINTVAAGSEVAPLVAETFGAGDVYALLEDLAPRHRARAQWLAELSTLNFMRQLETGNGAKLFPGLDGERMNLLARRVNEVSNVDPYSGIDGAETADNKILWVGDWSRYCILDRVGMAVQFVPAGFLMGSNGRPNGRVGWYVTWRSGADFIDDNAVRVLNVATAA